MPPCSGERVWPRRSGGPYPRRWRRAWEAAALGARRRGRRRAPAAVSSVVRGPSLLLRPCDRLSVGECLWSVRAPTLPGRRGSVGVAVAPLPLLPGSVVCTSAVPPFSRLGGLLGAVWREPASTPLAIFRRPWVLEGEEEAGNSAAGPRSGRVEAWSSSLDWPGGRGGRPPSRALVVTRRDRLASGTLSVPFPGKPVRRGRGEWSSRVSNQ